MKKIVMVWLLWMVTGVFCLAQPGGEFRGYYQNMLSFDYDSGSSFFRAEGDDFHGGGFGFVFNLTEWFGIFSDTNFLTGVSDAGTDLSLISQMQGAKVTARELGPLNLYAKGGIGGARFVFDSSAGEFVSWKTSFMVGGGVDLMVSDGIALFVEANQHLLSLPELTRVPERDKWASPFGLTTGIAFTF